MYIWNCHNETPYINCHVLIKIFLKVNEGRREGGRKEKKERERGRAGTGVDGVDLEVATMKGVPGHRHSQWEQLQSTVLQSSRGRIVCLGKQIPQGIAQGRMANGSRKNFVNRVEWRILEILGLAAYLDAVLWD
jgi:hypothetical protein